MERRRCLWLGRLSYSSTAGQCSSSWPMIHFVGVALLFMLLSQQLQPLVLLLQ